MLKLQPKDSPDQRIRDEFASVGGAMSTASFAKHLIDSGFWDSEELDAFAVKAVQGQIRSALKKHDAMALPFAGQTTDKDEDGAPVWKQRNLWSYETYELNVATRLTQSESLYTEAQKLSDECELKFGRSPMGAEQVAA